MSIIGWHALDIFFILLGCYFVIRGCFRGFVGEILTFAGFLCSLYVSFKFSGTLGGLLGRTTGLNIAVSQVLAIILVWLAVSLIVGMLRRILKTIVSAVSLGGIDRLFGIFCGLAKTVLVIYVVLVGGLLLAPVVEPTWMSQSEALNFAGRKWPEVRRFLMDMNVLPAGAELPDGTLDQILRPYRDGEARPRGFDSIYPPLPIPSLPLPGTQTPQTESL